MARCAALLALAGGAVAYTTHPAVARISAFVDTMDKAPKLPQLEEMKETECPRCGTAKGGAVNCCSGDGAWVGKCSMVAGEMEHTWTEGFAACIGAATQQQQAVLNASDFGAAETPGGVHEYPGELLKPLQKATEAIDDRAGTMPEALCTDKNLKMCPLWAQRGECEANPDYMHASCKLSCGLWYSKKAEDSVGDSTKLKRIHVWCWALAASLVWVFGVFTLATCIAIACGKCGEAFRWGHLATRTLAATFATALAVLAALPPAPLDTSLGSAALGSALIAILGTCFGAAMVAQMVIPAPQTFWPPAIHVESIPLSAPVPPAFICPITMAPMANPAITPRGTTYEKEALCDWINKQHRYPGGEARATRKPTHPHCGR